LDGSELISRYLQNVSPDIALACQWITIPILVVQGQAKIVWMMLGQTTNHEECRCVAFPAPDEQTIKNIHTATNLVGRSHGFIYCFLQHSWEQAVRGPSLGLPIAVAARLLQKSRPWPKGIYATGAVGTGGTLEPVAHIQEKHHVAQTSGCRLFLMPASGNPPVLQNLHSCTTFADACFAVDLYSCGIPADKAAVFQACRYSIGALLSHFHELPTPFLETKQYGQLLQQAAGNPQQYLEPLCACLQRCCHDRKRGQYLADLFSPEQLTRILEKNPKMAFKAFNWCLACISYANHSGRVNESTCWTSIAGQMLPLVDPEEVGKLLNHGFVGQRFNRYDFRPEPTPELAAFLQMEEKRQAVYSSSNYLLGALYGTLAQNYGFCGPTHQAALLEMTTKAEDAFGGKHYREKERLVNYQIYALLDSGMIKEATSLLNSYLDLNTQSGQVDWFQKTKDLLNSSGVDTAFKAALTLRVLADTGYQVVDATYRECIASILKHTSHPWQLIGLNLGKMLLSVKKRNEAEELFRHSLRICLAGGDTMHPMGLLSLTELHAAGLASKHDYEEAQKMNQWLAGTTALNTDHFRLILGLTNPKILLKKIMEKRNALFPFSYR